MEIKAQPKSRYSIEIAEDKQSFTVYGRVPVHVKIDGPLIKVNKLGENYHQGFGLYEVGSIIHQVAHVAQGDLKAPDGIEKKYHIREKIKKWANTKCSKAIAKKVRDAWKILLENANDDIINVHKAVYAASSKCSEIIKNENFFCQENKFFIKDIIQYRAAALVTFQLYNMNVIDVWSYRKSDSVVVTTDWKSLYGNPSNGSLRKTLMNLPGGIPHHCIDYLKSINLKRPVTNRLELLALCFSNRACHHDTIMFSTRKEIKHAIKLYADHMRVKPEYRKSMFISQAIGYITDYPDNHNGNIVGLARKSIDWHRNNTFANARKYSNYKPDTATALPPIDLPEIPGITFLRTVEDLWNEGMVMGHCVGSYDAKAVRGDCFIFHVNYKEEIATAEVDVSGRVKQVKGPRNQENKACKWATKKLNEWGKAFPPVSILNSNPELELELALF